MRILLAAAALLATWPAAAQGVSAWQPFIAEASARFGVPVPWIMTVMRIESGGRPTLGGRPIISPAGAMGLMQLMPATWAAMRQRLALGADPFDPHDNILAGTLYLRLMYDRFGYPGCFGAYNAGPGRYAAYLYGGRRLPGETVGYLAAAGAPVSMAPLPANYAASPSTFVRSRPDAQSARTTANRVGASMSQASVFAIPPRDR